jgi:hypothetical protein
MSVIKLSSSTPIGKHGGVRKKTSSELFKLFISLRTSFARAGVIKNSSFSFIDDDDNNGDGDGDGDDGDGAGVGVVIAWELSNFLAAILISELSKSTLGCLSRQSCFFFESSLINLSNVLAFSEM